MNPDPSAMGRGFPVRSHLHIIGDWLSDTAWAAHRDLPLFGHLHTRVGAVLNGVYDLEKVAQGKPAWLRTTDLDEFIAKLEAAELEDCVIVDRDPAAEYAIYTELPPKELWIVVSASGTTAYDGRIASSAAAGHKRLDEVEIQWQIWKQSDRTSIVGSIDDKRVFVLCEARDAIKQRDQERAANQ